MEILDRNLTEEWNDTVRNKRHGATRGAADMPALHAEAPAVVLVLVREGAQTAFDEALGPLR